MKKIKSILPDEVDNYYGLPVPDHLKGVEDVGEINHYAWYKKKINEKRRSSRETKRYSRKIFNGWRNVKSRGALIELESMIKDLSIRLAASEEALSFFANWYNRTQEVNILVPEKYIDPNPNKIII